MGCAAALLLAYLPPPEMKREGVVNVLFLQIDTRVVFQRRNQGHVICPGDVLLAGFLGGALPLAAVSATTDIDPRCVALSMVAYLHVCVFPRARLQAYATSDTLDEYREALNQLNWLHSSILLGTLFLVAALDQSFPRCEAAPAMILGAVRPQTLQPSSLTSTSRDGVVDHYRVRTAHTDTHWVIQIGQSFTLRIPRSDPDLADVVMVLLYEATGPDGKRYLDQATIGELFRLSRQMANARVALYQRRKRIEDVLSRERQNHTLTKPVVDAIHQLLLENPFYGATEIRRRLVEQGVITQIEDISLAAVTSAMRTVDYIAVRQRIEELMRNGEVVPDHEKLSQVFLREMAQLAEAAGKKIGQHVLAAAQLVSPQGSATPPPAAIVSEKSMPPEDLVLLSGTANDRVPPGWRVSFFLYFTCGAPYREIASYLGVHASTVYRRLAWIRKHLPPLQTLLGAILFSGVISIDEKYILVPKSGRESKMARWSYLFVAIDPYTYDLLHAEVYPARNGACARAFLLGLKAQGVLTPRVIVTDLWGPYETMVPEVYPNATHHQCVFHAEQATSTLMKDKLGKEYRRVPEARALHEAIVHLFRAGCRRTLIRRYQKLLQLRDPLVKKSPDLACVFDSVSRHFDKLANAYDDRRISVPRTNNAVERVIRTFTRRYKTMAGFESLETARAYVRLWSYYYRFRPFSRDANRRIRNRSPLEIAGYPVEGLRCLDLVMPPQQTERAS